MAVLRRAALRAAAVLGLALGASTAALLPALSLPGISPAPRPFLHGVAAADPDASSFLIWTRRTPNALGELASADDSNEEHASWNFALSWAVWPTEGGTASAPEAAGSVLAIARNDWTVSVLVSGLRASTSYSYRFTDGASGKSSATGQAKTAGGSPARVRLGVASCSSLWSATAFSAYRGMAAADLDLVVHLGDYIYSDVDKNERLRVPDFYSSCASEKKDGCEAHSLSEWRWVYLCSLFGGYCDAASVPCSKPTHLIHRVAAFSISSRFTLTHCTWCSKHGCHVGRIVGVQRWSANVAPAQGLRAGLLARRGPCLRA